MSSTTVLPTNVVHEAIDERQFVRAKIPARLVLQGGGAKDMECEIQDISLGGIGLLLDQPLKIGSLFNGSIKLKLHTVDLNIDTKLKIVSQRGREVGAEFVELDRQKRDILRYIISAYMSGDIADINGLFNVMQRENYIKERKTKQANARTAGERLKAALGSLLFFCAGAAALALIVYKSYLLFFQMPAAQAVVSANAYIISMPENGNLRYLIDPGQTSVSVGQPLASVSTQLASSLTSPADIAAMANLSDQDAAALLGRVTVETVIASPCDCSLYFPAPRLDGFAYKQQELVHLLPKDQPLNIKASVPFDRMDKLERVRAVEMRVLGSDETLSGEIVSSRVDDQRQMVELTIKPDRQLPLSDYQLPAAVEFKLGLPLRWTF
ncbi:PilZ domain-containing protein [Ectopseudomonas composti]|uniref:PilZ domain-containing protein n=1 Tax=Ectopseudomonas composti TaxID=658457 RepID=UPI000772D720|nr:PilZ domain-containing protein [Pseudomonas composti]